MKQGPHFKSWLGYNDTFWHKKYKEVHHNEEVSL